KLKLDSNGKEQDVSLRGRGVYTLSSASVSLTGDGLRWDAPLDHGTVPVAGGESIRRLKVTNRTNADVDLKPIWSRGQQGFELRGDTDTLRLDPDATVELVTVFDPDDIGSFEDSLILQVDDETTRGG